VGSCEHGNEPSGSMKGEEANHLLGFRHTVYWSTSVSINTVVAMLRVNVMDKKNTVVYTGLRKELRKGDSEVTGKVLSWALVKGLDPGD
jgi:hypothetical protein